MIQYRKFVCKLLGVSSLDVKMMRHMNVSRLASLKLVSGSACKNYNILSSGKSLPNTQLSCRCFGSKFSNPGHVNQENQKPQRNILRSFEVVMMRWCMKNLNARSFSSKAVLNSPRGSENGPEEVERGRRPLKLMDFTERIWPHLLKSIKNFFMSVLIRGYFDEEFSYQGFLNGAEQAVVRVSALISGGRFDELDSLVTREAVREIEQNYRKLDVRQREFIKINSADLFMRFIYEIGIIMDDATNKRYVEITAVVQGCHGLGELSEREGGSLAELNKNQENLYVCNYRFIREYTKGINDDWTINKLNHFLPAEVARRYGPFDR